MLFLDVDARVDTPVAECSESVQERENANEDGKVEPRRRFFSRAGAGGRDQSNLSVGLLSYMRRRSSSAPLLEHGGDFLLNRLFVQTLQRKLLLHSEICGCEGWEKSSARASSARKASRFATIERGEPWRGCVASRPRRARPRSDPASSTRAFRCRVGCPRRTVTGHHATLHAARLSDQDWRHGARGFHLLVALKQEIAHPLAPLGRLAQVEADLLHGLQARERSLGHVASNTALCALHARRVVAGRGTPVPRGSARDDEESSAGNQQSVARGPP